MKKLVSIAVMVLMVLPEIFAQEGTLDSTFNSVGYVLTNGYYGSSVCEAIQSDGKIVVAGKNSSNQRVVLRYNTNGTLDATFNGTGIVTTASGNGFSNPASVLIQSDGKIIVVGAYFNGSYNDHVSLIRYNSDGSLDNTFGTAGIVSTSIGAYSDYVGKAVLQSDGKIVVAAHSLDSWTGAYSFTVLRYTTTGTLDATFNTTGYNSIDLGCLNFGNYNMFPYCGVALQSDGKILFSGAYGTSQASRDMICIRLNTNGTIDNTFNSVGYVTKDLSGNEDYANDVATDNSGKILLGGKRSNYASVVRYNSDGTIDPTFGTAGSMYFDLGNSGYCKISQVTVLPDNKIMVGGMAYIGSYSIAVARLNSNGTLDNTFGSGGKVNCGFLGSAQTDGYGQAIQSDGKIVIAGAYNQAQFAVVRFKQKAFPDVSAYPTATDITYGETLASSTLSGGTVSVPGTWSFNNPSQVPAAGAFTADITFVPTDAVTYSSMPGTTSVQVNTKELTVTGAVAENKIYDGTTDAVINGATLQGIVGADNVVLDGAGNFAQKDTGTAIAVSTAFTLTGADIANYSLTQPTGLSANITAKELTVTGAIAENRIYDGTTDAVINSANLQGVVGTEDVVLNGSTIGTFAQKDTGTAIAVSTAFILTGADIANYFLTQPTGLAANITARELTIGGTFVVADKPFDGNTSATITNNNLYLIDTIVGDNISLTNVVAEFASSAVANSITVTIVSADLSGTDSHNYYLTITGAPTTTADITSGVGLEDLSQNMLTVWPNPAAEYINISFSGNIESLRLMNSAGQLLLESTGNNSRAINTSNLESGLYFIQIQTTSGDILTGKFLKN
ncbi:MAG: hypothetical protein CVU11_01105 [Bacteroidetes bacterium HGW-Bacteroidetes-6]|jgi:uncharacterized delta-60 repeat protein|nr:MAG: hypothetical protein CVU11_01105 [Bacteroidetes bacterium HGW-Bacteroidetes-6]